jgi:cytochrome c peroxidase
MKNSLIVLSCMCLIVSSCTNEGSSVSTSPLTDFKAPFYYGVFELPEDNPLTAEGVALGRMLFYESNLSVNGKISCATCHQQKLAFTDGRAFAVGASGNPIQRSSMSLNNLLWGPKHFFWDGRTASLEEQALIPIANPDEMGLSLSEAVERLEQSSVYLPMLKAAFGSDEITPDRMGKALASFQRTLVSQNSKYDRYLRGELQLSAEELYGKQLFTTHPDPEIKLRGGNCGDCHSQFLTSGFNTAYDGFKNNGIDVENEMAEGLAIATGKKTDRGKFKVPSLRNILLTAPYMHDGRFKTLEEVLDHYDHGVKDSPTLDPLMREVSNTKIKSKQGMGFSMTAEEKRAIIIFLKTLTDEEFISDKRFTDPHH